MLKQHWQDRADKMLYASMDQEALAELVARQEANAGHQKRLADLRARGQVAVDEAVATVLVAGETFSRSLGLRTRTVDGVQQVKNDYGAEELTKGFEALRRGVDDLKVAAVAVYRGAGKGPQDLWESLYDLGEICQWRPEPGKPRPDSIPPETIWMYDVIPNWLANDIDDAVQVMGDHSQANENPPRPKKYVWLAKALLLVNDDSRFTNAEIARSVGIHPSQLTRSQAFRVAANIARKGNQPALGNRVADDEGHATGVEAYDKRPTQRTRRQR